MASNVPLISFTDRGFVVPTDAAILAGVQADFSVAFGPLNFSGETPQGQWSTGLSAIISTQYGEFVNLANNVDPAYASGRWQDAIGRIYFLERNPALPTEVDCTCMGLAGTLIKTGSLAKADDGNIYRCKRGDRIGDGGTVSLTFQCTVTGPIPCPAGSVNKIYVAVSGWDTITNPSDGVQGVDIESRTAFEARRAESVAANASGNLPSIRGAVLSVSGVLDAYATENDTNAPVVVGNVTLPANCLYVAVIGGGVVNGTDEVARAIWEHKAPGCSYYGAAGSDGATVVTATVHDKSYSPPWPAYTTKYIRPASLPVLFAVDIADGPDVPSDAVAQIQAAIISAFAGGDGSPRERIGGVVYASRFYAAIAALGGWVRIISLDLGSSNDPDATGTATFATNVMTVTGGVTGAFAVGQTIIAAGVADGVKIDTLGTGVGGTGTYNLTVAVGTIGSGTVKAVIPADNTVEVEIDQVPTVSAANIEVTIT